MQKSSDIFKPSIHNAISTGTSHWEKIMAYSVLYFLVCVRAYIVLWWNAQPPSFFFPRRTYNLSNDERNCYCRSVEGTRSSYYHDWYSDSPTVVHLRLSEGVLPPSPSPTPRGTWESQEEAPFEAGSTSRLKFESAFCPFLTHVDNTAQDLTFMYLIIIKKNDPGLDLKCCTLQISYSACIDLREVEYHIWCVVFA